MTHETTSKTQVFVLANHIRARAPWDRQMTPRRWKANWIWIEGEPIPRNMYLYARKEFNVPRGLKAAGVKVTADSRYVLYLNGHRLGQGPVRSWPFEQSFDTYDIGSRLKPGKNVVAVLVQHFGISTFQYVVGRGGLLCQIDLDMGEGRKKSIGTDNSWRVRESKSYIRRAPRISCQQAWAEIYDARGELDGWAGTDFDDTGWSRAKVIGPVGMEPWVKLVERDIPFLTEEPVLPVALLRKRVVRPPRYGISFDLRPNLLPGYLDANPKDFTALVCTVVRAPAETVAQLKHVYGPWGAVRLNGEDVTAKDQVASLKLRKGENLLIIDVTGRYHDWFTAMAMVTEANLQFVSPLHKGAHWATVGPFESKEDEGFVHVWNAVSAHDLKAHSKIIKPVALEHECDAHVFALTTNQSGVAGETVRLANENGLFSNSENATVIFPSGKGDVELMLDFGREVVGFLEFELEAPEGVILDWNLFEFTRGWDIQYTGGLNNTLRYVTRKGFQKFHSIIRRGFRYALLTLRNMSAPVKIRRVRCLLNTFPVMERGDFLCSDPLLNQIWRMCRYTTRLCMEDTFVDCPAYEQTLWVGDARGEALINYVTFGELSLPRRCWKLVAQSLHRSPLTESQVPSGWQNVLTAWSLLWVLACEEYYLWSGDRKFLDEVYPTIAKMCANLKDRLNDRGLLEIEAWNMLDWAPMDTPGSGVVTHQNAFMVEALRRAARMAQVLGKASDAAQYLKLAESLRASINEHLWSNEEEAYIDSIHADGQRSKVVSQQTNAVVLLCDCATPPREERLRRLVTDVPEGWVKVGSPFAMFFILELLAKLGEFEALLGQIRKRWGFMLDMGTTTAWEVFGDPEAKHFARSYCHAWSAGPAYFLSTCQLGVRPASPGLRKVRIAPEPADLDWARGRVPTPHGEVEVSWEKKGREFNLAVTLPKGVEADAVLPASYRILNAEGQGIIGQGTAEGRSTVRLGKGASARVTAVQE